MDPELTGYLGDRAGAFEGYAGGLAVAWSVPRAVTRSPPMTSHRDRQRVTGGNRQDILTVLNSRSMMSVRAVG